MYFLYVFKALKKVVKEIIEIQRDFLWNGYTDKKGICWVSWKQV